MIPADAIEGAKQAVLLEMSDRRLLNDVDHDLHDEIATAIVQAAIGDGVVVPALPTLEMMSAAGDAIEKYIEKMADAGGEVNAFNFALRAVIYRAMLQAAPSVLPAPASVWKPIESAPNPQCPKAADLLRGGIIGTVEVVDVVEESASPWFFGPRGLVLRDPRPCQFVPAIGALGYFNWLEADPSIVPQPARWMLPATEAAIVDVQSPAMRSSDLFDRS